MDLEILWYCLIAVLWSGYFLLEGFDFGVGMLLPFVPRTEGERGAMFESSGTPWIRFASPIPQTSAMPALPIAFAHSQTDRHRGLSLFSRHSNETTRTIRKKRTSSSAT